MKKSKKLPVYVLSSLLILGSISLVSCTNDTNETTETKYKVAYTESNEYTVTGLKEEGYLEGEDVSFKVTVNSNDKEVDSVVVNQTKLVASNGTYSFKMPASNVSLTITLKAKETAPNPDEGGNEDDEEEPTIEGDTVEKIKSGEIKVGSFVTLKGKITLTSGTSAYLSDATGGIFIYNWSDNEGDTALVDGNFTAGDFVEIHAKVAINPNGGGALQLTSYENGGRIEEAYAKKLTEEIKVSEPIKLDEEAYKKLEITDTGNLYTFEATYVQGVPELDKAANIEFKIGETSTTLRTDGNSYKMYDANIDKLVTDFEALDLTSGDKVTITTALSWYNGPQFSYFGDGTVITKNEVSATAITISADKKELLVGEETTLNYTLTPSYASANVSYEITDGKDVVSLEGNVLTALKAGEAHVVAKTGTLTSEPLLITVTETENPTITIEPSEKTIYVDETFTLNTKVIGVANYELIYESNNEEVATIENSIVHGLKEGVATITVSLKDKPDVKASCIVTVKDVDFSIGQVKKEGETYTVKGVVAATTTQSFTINDGVDGILVYCGKEYSQEYKVGDYLKVSGTTTIYNGLLQFDNSEGGTTIDKITNETVPTLPTAIDLTSEIVSSWKSKASEEVSTLTTSDVKLYKWRAACDETGGYETLNLDGCDIDIEPSYLLASIKLEKGKLYDVEAYFNGYSTSHDYASVIVKSATLVEETIDATDVKINATSTTLGVNEKLTLRYTTTPQIVTTTPTWSSDNEEIATVDQNGVVTGLKEGEVNITVAFSDTVKDTIKLTIKNQTILYSKVYEYTSDTQPNNQQYNSGVENADDLFIDANYPLITGTSCVKGSVDKNGLPGLKIGSSSASGSLTLSLNDPNAKITKIQIQAISWINKSPSIIAYRGDTLTGAYQDMEGTTVASYTFDLSGQTGNSITIANEKEKQMFIITGLVIYGE